MAKVKGRSFISSACACTQMVSFYKCTFFAVHPVMCHCLCVTLTKNAQLTPILSIHCSTWTCNNTYASNTYLSIFFFLVSFSVCAHFSSFVKIKKDITIALDIVFCQLCKTDFYWWLKKNAIMIIGWVTSYVLIYIIRTCVPLGLFCL